MRSRKQILEDIKECKPVLFKDRYGKVYKINKIKLEILLDIRDLLAKSLKKKEYGLY